MVDDTKKIEHRMCVYHLQHQSCIERHERDIEKIWSAIDTMRGWVVAGSASAILALLTILAQVALKISGG